MNSSTSPIPTILFLLAITVTLVLNALTKRAAHTNKGLGFGAGFAMSIGVLVMMAIPIVSLLFAIKPQWLVKKELREGAKTLAPDLLAWLRLLWIAAFATPIQYGVVGALS
jgi:hypothetical protein